MNSRLALKGAALIAIGALGLVGLGAFGPVFDPDRAAADTAAPSWRQQVAARPAATNDTATAPDTGDAFRDRISEMMREHMGVTGDQADEWAGTMEDMMRSMHGDQADAMLEYCDENGGPGMMDGDFRGMMDGDFRGMMGGGAGGMMGGGAGGMMGGGAGGMMGGWAN